MLSAETAGHLSPVELFRLGHEGGGAGHPHLESCKVCRARVRRIDDGLAHAAEIDALGTAPAAPAVSPGVASAARSIFARARLADSFSNDLLGLLSQGPAAAETLLTERAGTDRELTRMTLAAACQKAAKLAMRAPAEALALVSLCQSHLEGRKADDPDLELEIESDLLESQALLVKGEIAQGVAAARRAHARLAPGSPLLLAARARYFLGSALGSAGETASAIALLQEARDQFAGLEQRPWVGRALAAEAVARCTRSNDESALELFETAASYLDAKRDGHTVAAVLQARACLLLDLDRKDEAREAFTLALEAAVASGATTVALRARVNLLGLAVAQGRTREALEKGARVLATLDEQGLREHGLYARLFLAEAHAAEGHGAAAFAMLGEARRALPEELVTDQGLQDLFGALTQADVDSLAQIRRVRAYIETWEQRQTA